MAITLSAEKEVLELFQGKVYSNRVNQDLVLYVWQLAVFVFFPGCENIAMMVNL